MDKALNPKKLITIFGIPLVIIGMMVLLANSSVFDANPSSLSIGITFDLLLTVPLIYFLLIRKTTIPKTTVIPFLIVGVVICSLILPAENQQYLTFFKTWLLPIVELFILSFIIFNLRKGIKHYKRNKSETFDFYITLMKTSYEILPKAVVIPVVTEIAVFYYGFIYWKKRKLKNNEFSYHKNSGTIPLLIAIIGIVAIETVTVHILLAKWSNTAALIFTILSIYSGIQIFGFLKSMLKRPIAIENNKLFLRYGIMTETTIDLKNIEAVTLSSKDIDSNQEARKLSLLGILESHNVIIQLKEENTLIGLYGVQRKYRVLALYVDDKIEFQNQINKALKDNSN